MKIKARLSALRKSSKTCANVLYSLPQYPLPPGSYHRRSVVTALARSIQNTDYLLDLIHLLIEDKHSDFWDHIQNGADPIPLTRRKTDDS
jgi:hypothetical protein